MKLFWSITAACVLGFWAYVSANPLIILSGSPGIGATSVPFPSDIAGLRLWIDASDGSTLWTATSGGGAVAADGTVARADDKSGNGRYFIQSATSSKPVRKVAVQNGRAMLRFDGTNDSMAITSAGFDLIKGLPGATVFMVRKWITVPTGSLVTFRAGTAASTLSSRLTLGGGVVSGKVNFGGRKADSDSSQTVNSAASITNTTCDVVCGVVDYAGASLNLYINGVLDGTSATFQTGGAGTVDNTDSLGVGIGATSGGSFPANVDIGEVIVYGSALSPTDRARVEAYLKDKWATP